MDRSIGHPSHVRDRQGQGREPHRRSGEGSRQRQRTDQQRVVAPLQGGVDRQGGADSEPGGPQGSPPRVVSCRRRGGGERGSPGWPAPVRRGGGAHPGAGNEVTRSNHPG